MEILDWLPALFASSVVAAYALVFAAAVALIVFLHRGDSLLGRASERQRGAPRNRHGAFMPSIHARMSVRPSSWTRVRPSSGIITPGSVEAMR